MTLWEPLRKGDQVDVVAPGWACRPELVEPAREVLKSWGLRPRFPEGLLEPWSFFANTDEKRGHFLEKALRASDSQAVWCLRAASGTHRVLPRVFRGKKPRKNKLVVGFSDITALHSALQRHWKWASLHGPMLDRLAQGDLDPEIVEKLRRLVFGEEKEIVFRNLRPMNTAARKARRIHGRTAGGNLTVIESLIGTRFAAPTKGTILFFEDVGERGYRLDRSFVHLEQAGFFKGVRAVVLGTFTGGEEPLNGKSESENRVSWALENLAEMLKIPVFADLPVGHGDLQWPFPLGTPAEIQGGELKIQVMKGRAR